MDSLDFDRDGVVIARGVISTSMLEALDREATTLLDRREIVDTKNLRCRWADHVTTGECRLDALDPVIDLSPAAAAIAASPAIHVHLARLFGEPAVLFKDKLIYKLAGAPGYPLHQDFIAWDEFPRSFTTVAVALDPATRENGATEVFLGQHHGGALAPEDGSFHRLSDDVIDPSRACLLELAPGDVAIFGGFVPHRSATNTSTSPRRLLYLSYQRASEGGDQRASHYAQFHTWLRERYAEHGRHDTWFR